MNEQIFIYILFFLILIFLFGLMGGKKVVNFFTSNENPPNEKLSFILLLFIIGVLLFVSKPQKEEKAVEVKIVEENMMLNSINPRNTKRIIINSGTFCAELNKFLPYGVNNGSFIVLRPTDTFTSCNNQQNLVDESCGVIVLKPVKPAGENNEFKEIKIKATCAY